MIARTLVTERLSLRALAGDDAPVLAEALNNINVSRWLSVIPFPYTLADAEWFVTECTEGRADARAISCDDKLIGVIGIDDGLGYWLAEPKWGCGYATEAVHCILQDHFERPNASTVTAEVFDGNTASHNVLTKLGFRQIGTGEHFCKARNAHVPGITMALRRDQWLRVRAS